MAQTTTATSDITERLRQEFRVRDWWPGMDSFDSARGETVPHPLANEAAHEIERLRGVVRGAVNILRPVDLQFFDTEVRHALRVLGNALDDNASEPT